MATRTTSVNVLFTCAGRRVSLIEAFRRALRRLGSTGRVVGADSTDGFPAMAVLDHRHRVPPSTDRGYIPALLRIVRQRGIRLLVPLADMDLTVLARNRHRFEAAGCTPLISSPDVIAICQDKRKTYRFFRDSGIDTPDTMSPKQALALPRSRYPLFLKPWDGCAGIGAAIAHDREELRFLCRRNAQYVVQECILGQEHTIDVFVDFQGCVRCAVPRRRIEVRSGEVSKGVTVKDRALMNAARDLTRRLGAGPGVINLQCFLTSAKKIKFIEINPRFGGGTPLAIRAGADFPYWVVSLLLGRRPRIRFDAWKPGLVMLRYDEAVWTTADQVPLLLRSRAHPDRNIGAMWRRG